MAWLEHFWRHVLMKCAECSCVSAAVRRFLSAGGVTEAKFIAWVAAPATPAVSGRGKLADITRQAPVAGPCTSNETAVTAPEWDA
jgi:hypothetical protein